LPELRILQRDRAALQQMENFPVENPILLRFRYYRVFPVRYEIYNQECSHCIYSAALLMRTKIL